jgi:hypothetical protein
MEHSSVKEDSIHATPETNENSLFYDLDPYPQFSSCIPPGLNRTTSAAKSDIVYTDIRGTVEIKGFDSRASGGAWGIGNGSSRKTQRMTSTSNFTPKPPSNELENPSTRARIFSDGSNAQGQPTAKINRITSMERIRDKFATNDVRIQGVFFTDMWSYMSVLYTIYNKLETHSAVFSVVKTLILSLECLPPKNSIHIKNSIDFLSY